MTDSAPHIPNNGDVNSTMSTQTTSTPAIPFDLWPDLMNHSQLLEFVGLSHSQAWTALTSDRIYRPFPKKRRGMVVGKYALRDFLNGRVIEKEDMQ